MIAVLDSGSGGVNVINECLKYYKQDFVYLVDNKNCPYGNKPPSELKRIVLNNINFLLKNYDIDFFIIGCNTASSILEYVDLEAIKCPILKTYPNLKDLVKVKGKVLLFATKNTITMSNYVKYYLLNYDNIKTLFVKDLPKYIDDKISKNNAKSCEKVEKMLKKSLFFNKKLKNIKAIALGCTHFKHIEGEICNALNSKASIFECEKEIAKISKFLVKKSKNNFCIKVILTKQDDNLKQSIINMFTL